MGAALGRIWAPRHLYFLYISRADIPWSAPYYLVTCHPLGSIAGHPARLLFYQWPMILLRDVQDSLGIEKGNWNEKYSDAAVYQQQSLEILNR